MQSLRTRRHAVDCQRHLLAAPLNDGNGLSVTAVAVMLSHLSCIFALVTLT